ncbi:MAG: dynamin family protein [Acetatifactor sp.]|nr:dynamin family protein [Acetatifactor sp.]
MTRVKIVCNPYCKEIAYLRWNGENWVKVTAENNESSKLVGEEFSTGFFPFKVKKIVDEIIHAYHTGNGAIELIFEGTDDDFGELSRVCESEEYKGKIKCYQSGNYLNNARDIVREVSYIFGGLKELIEGSVEDKSQIEADLARYSEAASEMIPICVFGNVSSGKSSFINALIGNEILPSGDEPITSKVYKISKSEDQNRAFINLAYDGKNIQVLFDDYDRIQTDLQDNALISGIKASLEESKNERVPVRVGAALAFINHYGIDDTGSAEQDRVSDLIELEVPYDEDGILKDSANKYILFDTPGSNSASNEKHKEVLKNAMKNLTNGLPVFVATSDTLDTEDNLKLYDEIRQYEDLVDARFTMIVVNKADKAKLPKGGFDQEQIDDILRQAIPRKMYSFGIYYVSSVMGLGAKVENNGDFVDDNYARIYTTERLNFSDPKVRFYTQLYKYNILPGQMKEESISVSEECENLIYANSGMYWLEKSIEAFASNYSAYNKCQQSQRFLRRVLDHTRVTIDNAKIAREEARNARDAALEESTEELLNAIERSFNYNKQLCTDSYKDYMHKSIIESGSGLTQIELKYLEQKLTEKTKEETGYLEKKIEAEKTAKTFWEKLLGGVADGQPMIEIDHEIDKATADDLFEKVKKLFAASVMNANRILNESSREFWQNGAAELRSSFQSIVMESNDIVEDKKDELSGIIATYQDIPFEDLSESVFLREDFDKYLFAIGNIRIGESYKLNLTKLGMTFNRKLKEYVSSTYVKIRESHKASFIRWGAELCENLSNHVQELNPTLRDLVESIRVDTEKISDLESRRASLSEYVSQIESLMTWKNR